MKRLKLVFLLFILSSAFAFIPKVRASTVEKFPTETTEIVAGWNNPTEAYIKDEVETQAEINNATQDYFDFGFDFDESAGFEKVFLCLYCGVYPYMEYPDLYTIVYLWANVGNSTYYFPDLLISATELYLDATDYYMNFATNLIAQPITIDVTQYLNSSTILNDLHVKIWTQFLIDYNGGAGVDALSIMVILGSNGTTESEFPAGFVLGGVLVGCVGLIGVLAIKRKR